MTETQIDPKPVKFFCFHPNPHLEEIVLQRIAREFGKKQFPGIENAEWMFLNTGGLLEEGMSAEDYLNEGILLGGTGGGMFDEHPTTHSSRKENECALTLLLKKLGVNGEAAPWQNIIDYTVKNDLKGAGTAFDVAHVLTTLYYAFRNDGNEGVKKAILWAMWAIEEIYTDNLSGDEKKVQKDFFREVAMTWLHARQRAIKNGLDLDEINEDFIQSVVERKAGYTYSDKVTRSSPINVAKYFRIDQRKDMECLLRFMMQDGSYGAHPFDIASIFSAAVRNARRGDGDLSDAIRWVFDAFDAKYVEQRDFWGKTRKEFKDKANNVWMKGPLGTDVLVSFMETDSQLMPKYARHKDGGNVDIFVKRDSNGNVQIFVNQRKRATHGIVLNGVVRAVRIREQLKNGKLVTLDPHLLTQEGRVEGCENWWYFPSLEGFYNGSLTANEVSPTKLSMNEILDCIRIGITPQLRVINERKRHRRGAIRGLVLHFDEEKK